MKIKFHQDALLQLRLQLYVERFPLTDFQNLSQLVYQYHSQHWTSKVWSYEFYHNYLLLLHFQYI